MAKINRMRKNLLVQILDWIRCQPIFIRRTLILKMAQIMPCCDLSLGGGDSIDNFSNWILGQAIDERKSYGAFLALKAIIDFVIRDMLIDIDSHYQRIGAVESLMERLLKSSNTENDISSLREYAEGLLVFPKAVKQLSISWAQFCEIHCSQHAAHPELWPGGVFWLGPNRG